MGVDNLNGKGSWSLARHCSFQGADSPCHARNEICVDCCACCCSICRECSSVNLRKRKSNDRWSVRSRLPSPTSEAEVSRTNTTGRAREYANHGRQSSSAFSRPLRSHPTIRHHRSTRCFVSNVTGGLATQVCFLLVQGMATAAHAGTPPGTRNFVANRSCSLRRVIGLHLLYNGTVRPEVGDGAGLSELCFR